jgi:uncharacterized protein
LFHLYFTVYFHKTTRSAEKMLAALLKRVGDLVKDGLVQATGLSAWNPIVLFLRNQSLRNYLALDDIAMWAGLQQMALARDNTVSELSSS